MKSPAAAFKAFAFFLVCSQIHAKSPQRFAETRSFTNGIGQEMIWVRPGRFQMGDMTGRGEVDEKPVRNVELSAYHLGATEVTQGQWSAVMGSVAAKAAGEDLPVNGITWEAAAEFCRKLTDQEREAGRLPLDYFYRLPTEAEWENAYRSRTVGDYAGDPEGMAWTDGNSGGTVHAVGGKKPNIWGFYDMHGNLWEWCYDWYGLYEEADTLDPQGPESGSSRVIRGGCWLYEESVGRSSDRFREKPDGQNMLIGFRVAIAQKFKRQAFVEQGTFTNAVGLQMVWLAPGIFRMGDLTGEAQWDEKPVRTVELSGHYIGATEISQEQWKAVMGSNPSQFLRDELPVESVQWEEAREFCRRLTKLEQREGGLPPEYVYALPTEAQWERACRAGTEGDYAGDLDAMAWYSQNSGTRSRPVGTKAPNLWGLYDMHGNVCEWCSDWYVGSYEGLGMINPTGPERGYRRVLRGGSWRNAALEYLRSAERSNDAPMSRNSRNGLRVVLIQATDQ